MGRDGRPDRRARPSDDLGVAGRAAGRAARRRTTAARHRLGDGADLLPRRACARWPATVPTASSAGIAALVRQQFIRRERSDLPDTDALAFRHLLIRDAAYDSIPKAVARGAARAVRRVARRRRRDRSASRTRSSAITWSRPTATAPSSGAGGERERRLAEAAGRRLAAAGERAFARSDFSASINLLSRASALLAPDDPLRLGILPDLGSALDWAGEMDGARAVFDEAIERATAAGDARTRMHAVIQATAVVSDPRGYDREARRDAEEALRRLRGGGR